MLLRGLPNNDVRLAAREAHGGGDRDGAALDPAAPARPPGIVRLRRSAPTTKSYWSRTGAFAPRGLCIRRLRNAPTRSPRSAPKARTAEAPNATPIDPNDQVEFGAKRLNGTVKSKPKNAPASVPPTSPRHVFPSPKSRSRSRRVRPKSMGVPPPKTTAIGFATKAGRKNHKACGIASRAIAAGVGS